MAKCTCNKPPEACVKAGCPAPADTRGVDRFEPLNVRTASELVGGLSNPSKMPGFGYSLPRSACRRGAVLRKIKGSVCSCCYAGKGRYTFDNTQNALKRRLASIWHPRWVEAMALLLNNCVENNPWFRWHDSGDLQNVAHLLRIFDVCRLTPKTRHWLPTHEHQIVQEALLKQRPPPNLVIRLSEDMLDTLPPQDDACHSTVHSCMPAERPDAASKAAWLRVFHCPYATYNNTCGPCRACWQKEIQHVSYHQH